MHPPFDGSIVPRRGRRPGTGPGGGAGRQGHAGRRSGGSGGRGLPRDDRPGLVRPRPGCGSSGDDGSGFGAGIGVSGGLGSGHRRRRHRAGGVGRGGHVVGRQCRRAGGGLLGHAKRPGPAPCRRRAGGPREPSPLRTAVDPLCELVVVLAVGAAADAALDLRRAPARPCAGSRWRSREPSSRLSSHGDEGLRGELGHRAVLPSGSVVSVCQCNPRRGGRSSPLTRRDRPHRGGDRRPRPLSGAGAPRRQRRRVVVPSGAAGGRRCARATGWAPPGLRAVRCGRLGGVGVGVGARRQPPRPSTDGPAVPRPWRRAATALVDVRPRASGRGLPRRNCSTLSTVSPAWSGCSRA